MIDEGFILSHKIRRAVFEGFIAGETDINMIAKKHRIIPRVAKKIAEELLQHQILMRKENRYVLTEEGKKLAETLRG
jgi:predicted transcriptional regulator